MNRTFVIVFPRGLRGGLRYVTNSIDRLEAIKAIADALTMRLEDLDKLIENHVVEMLEVGRGEFLAL